MVRLETDARVFQRKAATPPRLWVALGVFTRGVGCSPRCPHASRRNPSPPCHTTPCAIRKHRLEMAGATGFASLPQGEELSVQKY